MTRIQKPVVTAADQGFVELCTVLDDHYKMSGYYIVVPVGSSGDVDRYSDRYKLAEQEKKNLFDETSLYMRGFPPELLELAETQVKRRKKRSVANFSFVFYEVETQQRFVKSMQRKNDLLTSGIEFQNDDELKKSVDEYDDEDEEKKIDPEADEFAEFMQEEEENNEAEYGEDDYAMNYFENGDDDDEVAYGRDDGPSLDF